jgi:hypothetical protein
MGVLVMGTPLPNGLTSFTAWEPFAGHTVHMDYEGERWGRLGTAPLDPTHPSYGTGTMSRSALATAQWRADCDRAYRAITSDVPGIDCADPDYLAGEVLVLTADLR